MKLKLTEEQRKQVLSAYENKELIELEVFEPKPEKKIIKLDEMVGKDIDMEFSDYDEWEYVSKLEEICIGDKYPYWEQFTDKYKQCRIRESHWHSFKGDKCPLPEGLIISYSSMSGTRRSVNRCTNYSNLVWSLIYEFKVYGTADGWIHEWEKEE